MPSRTTFLLSANRIDNWAEEVKAALNAVCEGGVGGSV